MGPFPGEADGRQQEAQADTGWKMGSASGLMLALRRTLVLWSSLIHFSLFSLALAPQRDQSLLHTDCRRDKFLFL